MGTKPIHVGRETPRIDALERVSGQARYAEDIYLPGMLYARVLRSPLPHARVRSIDTSAAEALPGVVAILHCFNNDLIWSAGDQHGRRRLFAETARFAGEAVAAVAAVDRHTAEEALHLIRVDYEELPFVLTVDEALQEGAPQIHPGGNMDKQTLLSEVGNIEEGFRQADFIYENDFISKHHNNAQLERRASVARWDGDKLTVWASTQGIYNCRRDIAADLQLPLSKVRVICQYMGGGFGNKNQGFDFDLMAALLAQKTGRPVRLEFTRQEDFIAVHGRWSTKQHYRIGYKKDGTVTAIHLKGYSGMGAYLRSSGGINGWQNYAAPNIRSEISRVYTNASCGANYRAPAGPQGAFGIESAMDEIAERLQMDPVEFRLKNIVKDLWSNRTPLSSNGLAECLRRGAEAIAWAEKRRQYAQQQGPLRRGVGMAIGFWNASLGPSSAVVKIFPDGSVKIYVGVTDIGTGAKTTMAVIAAEALGVPLETISVVSGDTDLTPYSPGESGSRTTGYTGLAVIEAAAKVREQLLAQAASQFKLRREDLDLRDGKIISRAAADKSWNIAEVTSKNVDALTAAVTSDPEATGKARIDFAAHFAEVEVHRETANVKVIRYVAAHDSGTIINKLTAASQVKGGVAQGISMALREELIWDRHTGIPLTNHYHGAKLLIHPEAPEVEVIFFEPEDAYGPYGAKTIGEIPIVPVVGAIANAIYHATGARIRELPITPDKLLNALREAGRNA
ncbi:MAG: xanthine dehydrogenase family protein molybdopterin-binding subunit [Acidobacteria bacterium]|nr:xanthine dehydrogenase family protein molybdopterin-binding subunit [Acidobacteriota bacterium]